MSVCVRVCVDEVFNYNNLLRYIEKQIFMI